MGNNSAELLGSDENNLVVVVWQLIDLNQNQVSELYSVNYSFLQHFYRLSIECFWGCKILILPNFYPNFAPNKKKLLGYAAASPAPTALFQRHSRAKKLCLEPAPFRLNPPLTKNWEFQNINRLSLAFLSQAF